jgi:phosphatidylinositol alpha-1,6-mannosyltransferase
MELLIVTWNYPPRCGGIENVMANLAAGLARHHSVTVITAHVQNRPADETNVFRAPLPGLLAFAIYALWRGVLQLLRNPAIQVVFGGSALVAPLVRLLAWLFGRKAVIQVHGLDVIYENWLYQQLCARRLKSCDQVIANSAFTKTLAEEKAVPANSVEVIPPGVDSGRFAGQGNTKTAEMLGVAGKKVILFVGRLAKRKGLREFIEGSLPRIVENIPDTCLVVVGANPVSSLAHRDDAAGEIRAEIARQGLGDHVRLLGAKADDALIQLYQACDLVVLPALDNCDDVEGFGIVLLEAAAAGKPSVATRVGGIPDAIQDRLSGVLVAANDSCAMADAVIDLLSDKSKRQQMGERARRRAQEEFSWDRIVRRYEATFRSLLPENLREVVSAAEQRVKP